MYYDMLLYDSQMDHLRAKKVRSVLSDENGMKLH
jgi:hypothetical protein